MFHKFLIIILSLLLLAEDEKSKSAVLSEQSQVRLQSVSEVKEIKPLPNISDENEARRFSEVKSLIPQQLIFLPNRGNLFKALAQETLVNKPDVNKALSMIKKIAQEASAQGAKIQNTGDASLSDACLPFETVSEDPDKAFEPNFTRHKMELNLEIPEQQDFYDELVYLSALGLNLAKDTMSSSKMEGKKLKLFTLVFGDQSTEDNFKNELKYFRKIAKIRALHPDAILPKTYLEVAQKLEGEELQNALNNYYREYESQVKSVLAGTARAKAKELPYHDWSRAIQASIVKSKDSLLDYQQLLGDLIELDYKPTPEITAKLAQIIHLLQSENHVVKTNLAKIQEYLEKNNFDSQLIIDIKKLFNSLESFRKILLTKCSLKALNQDSDLDLSFAVAYENIKKLFDTKAIKFYDQQYE